VRAVRGDRLSVVRRRYLVITIATLLGAGVAYGLAHTQHAQYGATSQVALNQQSVPAGAGTGPSSSAPGLQRQVETDAAVAHSAVVAQKVLAAVPPADWTSAHWTSDQLLANSSVQPSADADVLTFHVTAPSAALAGDLATAYANTFADFRNGQVENAIKQQISITAKKVTQANAAILADQTQGGQPSAVHRQQLSQSLNDQAALRAQLAANSNGVTTLSAGGGAHQTAPRPFRSALLGGLIGLVMGIALAFLLEALDRRVVGPAEIEELLQLPLLGRIGVAPREYRRRNVVSLDEPDHVHAESYRMVTTSVELAMLRGSVRTIAVSSAVQGEGKSTLVANLAVGLAATGRSVALVDLDLRRPTIARMFRLDGPGPGVGEVLRGQVPASACLQAVGLGEAGAGGGRLDVLSSRLTDRSAVPYLTRASLARLVDQLPAEHDIVLFDTPPLLAVSDPAIVASSTDAMLVVVRPGVASKQAVADLAALLTALDVPVLGCVLTGAGHGHGYGYGYGYGVGAGRAAGSEGEVKPPAAARRNEVPLVTADRDA
jgi:succinoglycan biosynthesis transport protein ExoP